MLCLSGCGEGARTGATALRLHSLAGCPLPPPLARQKLELLALGDFEAGNESAEILSVDAAGTWLSFPAATRAVTARIGETSVFSGHGERRAPSQLDLVLWPDAAACTVFRPDGAQGYPGRHGGQALTFAPEAGVIVAAGGNDAIVSDAIVGTLTFDPARGSVRAADTSEAGVLREPRAFATLTPFAEHVLIAGGETPVFGVPARDIEPQDSAELFDPVKGLVVGEPLELRSRRARHAAVVLDDGRTLLVGGRSQTGGASFAQYQLEIVDPRTRHADVAGSIQGRIAPHAVKLTDGRVFVGGGVDIDGQLVEPVAEWLSPVAKPDPTQLSEQVEPRFERAFVATLGGGVLAVGGCSPRAPNDDEDAELCARRCGQGCPPLDERGRPVYDAWWIARDGEATPVGLSGIAAPRPILIPGSDGSPWLVAATAEAPDIARLFRFDPWNARFALADVPEGSRLPRPGFPAPVPIDPDAFVWLDDDEQHGELVGLRLGTRNRYAQDFALVLLSDPLDPSKALHLAPDGPLGESVSYTAGALSLRAPDVTVHVTDTDYLDATITLRVDGDALPLVLLGDSELGGERCPWPEAAFTAPNWPQIARRGTRADLYVGGERRTCEVSAGRLPVALRAGKRESRVRELSVKRDATR